MVVGFASGGISDVLARAIAAKVSLHIGQQVIVDNKPGAGTTIAGDLMTRAAPDGYTIWFEDITRMPSMPGCTADCLMTRKNSMIRSM